MKKMFLVMLSLLVVAMFLVGCAQEKVSDEELEAELSELSAGELDEAIETVEAQDTGALAGQAYMKRIPKIPRNIPKEKFLKTAYKVKYLRIMQGLANKCARPNYMLEEDSCPTGFGSMLEDCYTCSIVPSIKNKAECLPGFDYVYSESLYPEGFSWVQTNSNHGFECINSCFEECDPTINNHKTACTNNCPKANELTNPCPEGFTFGTTSKPWLDKYTCYFQLDGVVCNSPGYQRVGGNSGSGDTYCGK